MKICNVMRILSLAVVLAATGAAMAPQAAHADASCTSLINSKYTYLQQHQGSFNIEMTIHKDPLADIVYIPGSYKPPIHHVTYSSGKISPISVWSGWLGGCANLQFSDRYQGLQNFNINAAEELLVLISPDGALTIWNWDCNRNFGYYLIVDGTDMSCTFDLMSKYSPGLGQVTLTFLGWNPPDPVIW